MKVDNIYKLIEEVSKLNVVSFEYEEEGSKISMKFEPKTVIFKEKMESEKVEEILEESKGTIIKSPIVGTFYASSTEDGNPFVKVGDVIGKGDVVAIIEAMKLMNEIKSECEGTVNKVYLQNGDPVEYGQPLFEIV
ncbi:MAG: acetyl-CoA carboxylase, biotin carboxyl carrier protein [Peptostreptococcaceae bacterium]|nr:acetyl-CoA carboxylase, biotin carboxyl carrier protein [Peptostreptococcaceae bacterium]